MKTIEVVAAIIVKDGKVFATQRGYGEWKGWWEFPGGKMESGERREDALRREIKEELDADVAVGELMDTVEWDYPTFHLTMHCFLCSLESESLHLNEHDDAAWLSAETLHSVKWLPADLGLLDKVEGYLMDEKKKYKYFAFVSYQSDDREWAKWFHHSLEHFHLPTKLANQCQVSRKGLRPLFLDEVELAGGNLSEKINYALNESRYLLVICSPNSAGSEWVDKEVKSFIDSGRTDRIVPIIIGGIPYAKDPEQECFVPSLKALKGTEREILGINAQGSKDTALIKVIAELLGVSFDTLWQRHEKEKEQEKQRILEEKRRLQRIESRYLAEKSIQAIKDGHTRISRHLALEALPVNVADPNDRPYIFEAEAALRRSMLTDVHVVDIEVQADKVAVSPDGKYIAALFGFAIKLFNARSGGLIGRIEKERGYFTDISFSEDGRYIISGDSVGYVEIWAVKDQKLVRDIYVKSEILSVFMDKEMAKMWVFHKDHRLALWDMETKECLSIIEAPKKDEESDWGYYSSVAEVPTISHDWSYFAYRGSRGVYIIDLRTKKVHYEEYYYAKQLAFNPCDYNLIYSDSYTYCRNLNEGITEEYNFSRRPNYQLNSEITAMCHDRENRIYFALESGKIHIANSMGHRKPSFSKPIVEGVTCMACSADGQLIAMISGREMHIWDRKDKGDGHVPKAKFVSSIVFSPDSKSLFALGEKTQKIDINTLTIDKKFKSEVFSKKDNPQVLPDGTLMYTRCGSIRILDTKKLTKIEDIDCVKADWSLCFNDSYASSDCKKICYFYQNYIYIYDRESKKTVKLLLPEQVIKAEFCCNDQKLLVLTENRLATWDIKRSCFSKVLASICERTDYCLSPDRDSAAVISGNSIIIMSLSGDGEQHISGAHDLRINSIAYSSDGKLLITSSDDCTVKVWKLGYENPLLSIKTKKETSCARFSPDMRKIAYVSYLDVYVRDFLPLQELIDHTREVYMIEPLTSEERKRFYLD
jgi:8-oxo-dGTP diphosphatase